MSKARVFGLGFGVLLILAAFGVVLWQTSNMPLSNTAFAQGATATPTAAATTAPGATPAPPQQPQQQQAPIGDSFWGLLAAKLGVTVDTLKTQAVEVRKQMIDQAVTDGRVTQEQADAIKGRITSDNIIAPISLGRGTRSGVPGNQLPDKQQDGQHGQERGPFGGFGFPGRGFGGGGAFGGAMLNAGLDELNAIASALKLEPKALIEQLSQGKTLADIATAQSVDQAAVKQAIITTRTAQIDQLLSLGVISEVQASTLKARLTPENIDLTRGFHFNFQTQPQPGQQQQSSEIFPAFGDEESFGIASDANGFALPFGEIQFQ